MVGTLEMSVRCYSSSVLDVCMYCRCIAVSSLGVFLYEEMTHGTLHAKFAEAVNVLLATLGVG